RAPICAKGDIFADVPSLIVMSENDGLQLFEIIALTGRQDVGGNELICLGAQYVEHYLDGCLFHVELAQGKDHHMPAFRVAQLDQILGHQRLLKPPKLLVRPKELNAEERLPPQEKLELVGPDWLVPDHERLRSSSLAEEKLGEPKLVRLLSCPLLLLL